MNSENPTQRDYDNWAKDPKNWFLGTFYYNSKDKRFFIPKRIQSGNTINFANPYLVFIIIFIWAVIPFLIIKN